MWHLVSDESAYIFLREAEEERVLVAFNNSVKARDFRLSLNDTPAQEPHGVKTLFGEGRAEITGKETRISAPAKSLSIFVLN